MYLLKINGEWLNPLQIEAIKYVNQTLTFYFPSGKVCEYKDVSHDEAMEIISTIESWG